MRVSQDKQVSQNASSRIGTFQETLDRVRATANATTTFILVESAYKIDLPVEVHDSLIFKDLERIGNDFILLQNAILSYQKEQVEGVNNNVISVCRARGMSAQDAFDYVGGHVRHLYMEWSLNQDALPSWGKDVDADVQEFLDGIVNCALGNLHWR
jgi:hypothetical protein